ARGGHHHGLLRAARGHEHQRQDRGRVERSHRARVRARRGLGRGGHEPRARTARRARLVANSDTATATERSDRMRLDLKRVLKNYGILFAFVLVCVILASLSPVFLRWNNLLNIIRQSSIFGIMAVGMTFVILTGGIDLSVGSILAVSGALAAGM